jgi:hypothetical protein
MFYISSNFYKSRTIKQLNTFFIVFLTIFIYKINPFNLTFVYKQFHLIYHYKFTIKGRFLYPIQGGFIISIGPLFGFIRYIDIIPCYKTISFFSWQRFLLKLIGSQGIFKIKFFCTNSILL